jgi:signal transduction histidine kinase
VNETLPFPLFCALLEFGRKLPHASAEGEPETILADLARITQAGAVGLCTESANGLKNRVSANLDPATVVRSFPWDQPTVLQSMRESELDIIAHADEAGHWRITAAWESRTGQRCWLWLRRPPTVPWTAEEAELLPWVAQKLIHWLGNRGDFFRTFSSHATQQRLEHSAQVTSKLSHDFGNLLTGIMGFTELSLMSLPADSPVRKHLNEVLGQAIEGGRWIHKLHRFCRRTQVSPEASTSLLTVLAAESNRLSKAHGAGLKFDATLAVGLPEIKIDPESLQAVLSELLGNSAEAMHGTGTIRVSARVVELAEPEAHRLLGGASPGPHVEIVIQDTGPGLCDEARVKLFRDMYYSSKFHKRGLGLLVVHGLMMTHRGGFHWEQLPGEGLRTRIFLPVATPLPD